MADPYEYFGKSHFVFEGAARHILRLHPCSDDAEFARKVEQGLAGLGGVDRGIFDLTGNHTRLYSGLGYAAREFARRQQCFPCFVVVHRLKRPAVRLQDRTNLSSACWEVELGDW